jgi:hypothetical protein
VIVLDRAFGPESTAHDDVALRASSTPLGAVYPDGGHLPRRVRGGDPRIERLVEAADRYDAHSPVRAAKRTAVARASSAHDRERPQSDGDADPLRRPNAYVVASCGFRQGLHERRLGGVQVVQATVQRVMDREGNVRSFAAGDLSPSAFARADDAPQRSPTLGATARTGAQSRSLGRRRPRTSRDQGRRTASPSRVWCRGRARQARCRKTASENSTKVAW